MAFTFAFGTLLQKETAPGSGVFTTIAQLGHDITGPGQKSDTVDTTTHNQASPYKSFIAGLREGGDIKFPVFFDANDATHTGLIDTFEAGVPVNWKLVPPFSPAASWSFAGLIIDIGHHYKIKEAVMADITIKVSGKPTLA
jgi:predicted secreted protein